MEDELYHHGIKGQRWGIRRSPEELGHAPTGKRRDGSGKEAAQKAYYLKERAKALAEKKQIQKFRKKEREFDRKKTEERAKRKLERAAKKLEKQTKKEAAEAAKAEKKAQKEAAAWKLKQIQLERVEAIRDSRVRSLKRGQTYLETAQKIFGTLGSAYDLYKKVTATEKKEPQPVWQELTRTVTTNTGYNKDLGKEATSTTTNSVYGYRKPSDETSGQKKKK